MPYFNGQYIPMPVGGSEGEVMGVTNNPDGTVTNTYEGAGNGADLATILSGMGNFSGSPTGGSQTNLLDISKLNGAMDGLGTTMKTGFNTTNQNLTTGFNTTNQNLNTGFNNMAGNFGTLNDQNAARDIALNSYLASLNTGVQDTLSGLGTNLNQVGSNLNTYYGDLSTGQQTLTTGVDNMNSEFGDYRQQYNTDVSSANRKRAEIMESVGGTATQTQDMIAQQGAVGAPYGQQGGQSPYGNPQSPNPQQQSPMMNTVSMAKDVLSSNQNINPQAASMLGDFVSAFSPDGQFIPNGPDANGIPTIRNMNQQGVMQIAKQNAQGQYVTSGVTSQQQIQSLIQAISIPQGLGAV